MSGNDFGQLAYLVLLLVVVGTYFLVSNRRQLGSLARHAVLWALIFVGMVAAVGMWGNIRQTLMPQQSVIQGGAVIELPRQADGHYYARLNVNGTDITFMVDTGASDVVLTGDAARAAGIDTDRLVFSGTAATANGSVRTAAVTLDNVSLGPVEDFDLRAMVNEGNMRMPLLGMTYLDRFSRIEIADGALRLTR
ncbi:retropepsin-like aspartic protease family protein [Pseudooceanicola aestuarii]|uniref:retropepsin-like aspartic protease family protein n=1 Tax=Pseudooceanicola aestuarii TaxID=2697319 RepID=UPI0013D826E7|nr:TIGR02281 family clan AA aspartic protease [Pseudooceanicola aestuarii]